ncbi:MAG: cation diffusion facilitator family transporter [Candidatus Aramenus sulfurataquae]|uniref:Cation diffusion facilitator family transporter n=2 Tax=Candidatus Aramenus sulfurataquae TaxID=1326980 RepID=W7L758_9CREN|nr:MAG: cation diffusion facilitator family transporter [Candidatus Aramenus sulfurataquae]MCL7343714.1 cation transporter [Candidatus Aramenus sulfurataquae]
MLPLEKLNSASRAFLVTSVMIFGITSVEIVFAKIYNSSLLIVDSYHGFLDAFGALLYSILLKIVYRRTKRFPWGLYNLESLAILMTSGVIVFLSIDYLSTVVKANYEVPAWLSVFAWASSGITLIAYLIERSYSWIGVVRTDLLHSKLDFVMEIISGIAIISENYYFNISVIVVIILFILVDTAREVKESILSLVGASCECPIKERIYEILKGFNIDVSKVYVRRLGSFFMVYVIVRMPENAELRKAYRVRKKVNRLVYSFDSVAMVEVKIVPKKVKTTKGKRLANVFEKSANDKVDEVDRAQLKPTGKSSTRV